VDRYAIDDVASPAFPRYRKAPDEVAGALAKRNENPRRAELSKGHVGRCLAVIAIMCGIAVVPAIMISLYVGYYFLIPAYSAVAYFDKPGFNLRLDLYLTADEARDSGRYLSVINDYAYHTVMIPGWDWPHRARSNVYIIDPNHIAVLSALGYDYKITLKPFEFAPVVSDPGEQWQYLGAFEFAFPPGEQPRLEFFDHNLAECIPMGMTDQTLWAAKARPRARYATCPGPQSQ